MSGFMKIAPYFKYNTGDKISYLKSESGDLSKTKLNSKVFKTETFDKIVKDLTFYVRVTDVEVELNVEVKKYQLDAPNSNVKSGFAYYHSGNGGYTLKLSCITTNKDKTQSKLNLKWLEQHFLNNIPVNIVVDTEIIPNGVYDISSFTGFKLLRKNVYEFDLELTTHTNIDKKLTNKVNILQTRLNRCKQPKNIILSPKQIKRGYYYKKKGKKKIKVKIKQNSCIGYVNRILKSKGCYTKSKGKYTIYKKYNKYYTKYTVDGLKRYAQKWNKKGLKPKLKTNGKMSKNMWNAIKRYNEL